MRRVRLSDIAANAVDGSKVADNSLAGADIDESTLDIDEATLNPTVVQTRVEGTCGSSEAIQTISHA